MKSRIFSIIFIITVFAGLIIYIINVDGIENIKYIIQNADYTWILLGFLCVAIEWILESIVFHIPLKNIYPEQKFSLSLRTNIIGRFFNNITPFSSGGQPLQAYILSKHGVRASDAFSVLMMKFVVYQFSLFTWAIILLIANFNFFNETFKDYIWLVLLGFFMNLIAVVFIILIGVNKKIITRIFNPIIKLLAKIRIGKHKLIKNLDTTLKKVDDSISNYSDQFNKMRGQKVILIKMYLIGMVQLLAYFSIPFMIYKSFGNAGTSYFEILTIQTYLLLIMSFIPTPGSGLGAEGGFALLYNTVFLNGLNMAILFWRAYTFYLPILVGIIMLVTLKKKANLEKIDIEELDV